MCNKRNEEGVMIECREFFRNLMVKEISILFERDEGVSYVMI